MSENSYFATPSTIPEKNIVKSIANSSNKI